MADARDATTYIEALGTTTAAVQDAATYVEVVANSTPEAQVATVYFEVLTPVATETAFIGWGSPI